MSLTLYEYPTVNPGPGESVVNAGFNPMLWKFSRKDFGLTKIASTGGGDLQMIIITNDPDFDTEIEVGDQVYVSNLILDTSGQIAFKAGIYEVLSNESASLPAAQYGWKLKDTHNSAGDVDLEIGVSGNDYLDWVCYVNILKRNYRVILKWRFPDIPSDVALGYYAYIFRDEFSYSPGPDGFLEVDGQAIAKTLIKPDFTMGANMYSDELKPMFIGLGEPIGPEPYAQGVWDEGEEDCNIWDLFDDNEHGIVYPIHAVMQSNAETNLHQYTMGLVDPAKFLTNFKEIPWYPGKPLPITYMFDVLNPPADGTWAIGVKQFDITGTEIDTQGATLNGLGDSVDTLFLDQQFTLHDQTYSMDVWIGPYSGGVWTSVESEVKKIRRKACSLNDLYLIWRNNLGGISHFVFGYNQDGIFEEQDADRVIRILTAYAEQISESEFEGIQELNSRAYTAKTTQYGQFILMQDANAPSGYTQVINRITHNEWKTRSSKRLFVIELQIQDINQKLP